MSGLTKRLHNERGIALIVVMLIALVVAAISVSASLVTANTQLVINYGERESILQTVADGGLEMARSMANRDTTVYPDSGFAVLESGASVTDASGATIPGVRRWLYIGPTGITSGQYGVFGSVVSVAEDGAGNKVVRRGEIVQESFAKYAYFTDDEGSVVFCCGDVIWGPVHSNDDITIQNTTPTPRAIFNGPVNTNGSIFNKAKAQYNQGYTENAAFIPLPQTAALSGLQAQATAGGTAFTSTTSGNADQATMRIEFAPLDLDNDGFVTGNNEGFFKVYSAASDPGWVVASRPSDYSSNYLRNSVNCGHRGAAGTWHNGTWRNADDHATSGSETGSSGTGNYTTGLTSSTRRCYLGGHDSIVSTANPPVFTPTDSRGAWQLYTTTPDPLIVAKVGATEAQYYFPITRAMNPNFKGVIYVSGKVAVSGTVRGRVTLAASSNIIIADDVKYATDPSSGTCNDILGVFSGASIVISDNTLNAPARVSSSSSTNYTFDDTRDEFIHGFMLALGQFTAHNYATGVAGAEPCGTSNFGRGCLYLTGGIIQSSRGPVTLTSGTAYLKRYSYDPCGFTDPPPYFPTTGRFSRGRYYEVNPVGFNVTSFYDMLTP